MWRTVLLLWALVLLHTPNGHEIYVNAEDVVFIGPAIDWSPKAGAVIIVHDRQLAVRESVSEVRKALP